MRELVITRLEELSARLNVQGPALEFALLEGEDSAELSCVRRTGTPRPPLRLIVNWGGPRMPAVTAGIANEQGQVEHVFETAPKADAFLPVLDVLAWVLADSAMRTELEIAEAITPWHPAWVRLAVALNRLARAAGVDNAYVLDASTQCWCSAHSYEDAPPDGLVELTERALSGLAKPLARGGKLRTSVNTNRSGNVYLCSFASIYILALRSARPIGSEAIRRVDAALPDIEALTLALPSPEDPGSDAGEAAVRG